MFRNFLQYYQFCRKRQSVLDAFCRKQQNVLGVFCRKRQNSAPPGLSPLQREGVEPAERICYYGMACRRTWQNNRVREPSGFQSHPDGLQLFQIDVVCLFFQFRVVVMQEYIVEHLSAFGCTVLMCKYACHAIVPGESSGNL